MGDASVTASSFSGLRHLTSVWTHQLIHPVAARCWCSLHLSPKAVSGVLWSALPLIPPVKLWALSSWKPPLLILQFQSVSSCLHLSPLKKWSKAKIDPKNTKRNKRDQRGVSVTHSSVQRSTVLLITPPSSAAVCFQRPSWYSSKAVINL